MVEYLLRMRTRSAPLTSSSATVIEFESIQDDELDFELNLSKGDNITRGFLTNGVIAIHPMKFEQSLLKITADVGIGER